MMSHGTIGSPQSELRCPSAPLLLPSPIAKQAAACQVVHHEKPKQLCCHEHSCLSDHYAVMTFGLP